MPDEPLTTEHFCQIRPLSFSFFVFCSKTEVAEEADKAEVDMKAEVDRRAVGMKVVDNTADKLW